MNAGDKTMIGERLQELRKDRGVSQVELAKLLGVSSNTISSYECNRSDPDDNLKIVIAKYFDISLDYLLGLKDEPSSFKEAKNIIILPKDFESEDIESVKEYVQFIKYKKIIVYNNTK